MTYTPPEGVTIGSFTADTLPASFSAPVNSVVSYKIYGTEAGVGEETENLFDINTTWYKQNPNDVIEIGKNEVTITTNLYDYVKINVEANTDYTLSFEYQNIVGSMHRASITTQDKTTIILRIDGTSGTFNTGNNTSINILFYAGGGSQGKTKYKNIMLTKGSTAPTTYIPFGYKIPILLTDGTSTSNYDLFIGDSKLYENEYVDYTTQKIYKLQEGELTPTDPPLPFQSIITYDGENTISSTETLGDVEFTGEWAAIMGSTEEESIDIEFTVDAEEYIAFVTVDDDPSIQVFDTITMPASANSFTLQVVSWGREQYTDTVYNALS